MITPTPSTPFLCAGKLVAGCIGDDISKTNFALNYLYEERWTKSPTTYTRYCFRLTSQALRGPDRAPCDPRGSQCCKDVIREPTFRLTHLDMAVGEKSCLVIGLISWLCWPGFVLAKGAHLRNAHVRSCICASCAHAFLFADTCVQLCSCACTSSTMERLRPVACAGMAPTPGLAAQLELREISRLRGSHLNSRGLQPCAQTACAGLLN